MPSIGNNQPKDYSTNTLYEQRFYIYTSALHEEGKAPYFPAGKLEGVRFTDASINKKGDITFLNKKTRDAVVILASKKLGFIEKVKEWVTKKIGGKRNIATLSYLKKGKAKAVFVKIDALSKALGISKEVIRKEMETPHQLQALVFHSLPAESFKKNLDAYRKANFIRELDNKHASDVALEGFKGNNQAQKILSFLTKMRNFTQENKITGHEVSRFLLESGNDVKTFFRNFQILDKNIEALNLQTENFKEWQVIKKTIEAINNIGVELRKAESSIGKVFETWREEAEKVKEERAEDYDNLSREALRGMIKTGLSALENKTPDENEKKYINNAGFEGNMRRFFASIPNNKPFPEINLEIMIMANYFSKAYAGNEFTGDNMIPFLTEMFRVGGEKAVEILADAQRFDFDSLSHEEASGIMGYSLTAIQSIGLRALLEAEKGEIPPS